MKRSKVYFIVGSLLIVCLFFVIYYPFATSTYEITGTVKEKYAETYGDVKLYYAILLTGEKLECDTNLFLHDSNPEGIYEGINVNQSYVFTCWGWHDGVWEPNVIKAILQK